MSNRFSSGLKDACRVICRARWFSALRVRSGCDSFGGVFVCTVIISSGSVEVYSTDGNHRSLFSLGLEIAAATVTVGWC